VRDPGWRPLFEDNRHSGLEAAIEKSLAPSVETCIALGDEHGPEGWRQIVPPERLAELIREGERLGVVVLAADIRRSTALMKEAIVPLQYARTVGMWIAATRYLLRGHGVWFDKFTGDGFLAYWLVPDESEIPMKDVINTASQLIAIFDMTIPEFRRILANVPSGTGLAVGVDFGLAALSVIADDLTVIGPPVVGAVRMVGLARAREVCGNVRIGHILELNRQALEFSGFKLRHEVRATKEYPDGQEVFLVEVPEPDPIPLFPMPQVPTPLKEPDGEPGPKLDAPEEDAPPTGTN
jgi:Adenylate and Guanylate cyclase catalytic domain